MRASAAFVALALMLASCVTPAAPRPPTPMTVSYVRAHIEELHGKTVRMRGEMNNCTSLTCLICEDIENDETCLGLDFYGDTNSAVYLHEELYRFATITIDARIDALCEVNYDPDQPVSKDRTRDIVIFCTDRASSIEDARVVSVDARKPASLGRFDMYEGEPLEEANAEASGRIRTFLTGLPWIDNLQDLQLKIYIDPDSYKELTESFIFCECIEDDCTSHWPTWSGQATTRSPANPYVCSYISRIGDNWVLTN